MQRYKVSRKVSEAMFERSAARQHKLNGPHRPMRGGFRI